MWFITTEWQVLLGRGGREGHPSLLSPQEENTLTKQFMVLVLLFSLDYSK